jgi:hypothetical protein
MGCEENFIRASIIARCKQPKFYVEEREEKRENKARVPLTAGRKRTSYLCLWARLELKVSTQPAAGGKAGAYIATHAASQLRH